MRQMFTTLDRMVIAIGRQVTLKPWIAIGSAVMLMASISLVSHHRSHTPKNTYSESFSLKNEIKQTFSSKPSWESVEVKAGNTLSQLLQDKNIPVTEIKALIAAAKQKKVDLTQIKVGQTIKLRFDKQQQLSRMKFPVDLTHYLILKRQPHSSDFTPYLREVQLESKYEYASATIENNLYLAAKKSHVSQRLIMEMAHIFAWQLNFTKQIHPGDHFSLLYNSYYRDGKKVKEGEVVAAVIKSKNKTLKAIRFTDKHGRTGYYSPKGINLQRSLMRAPIKHARISSYFRVHRMHPILHIDRPHYGVDYAAPAGTPIPAAGNGMIVRKRYGHGYGNYIEIRHNSVYSTRYGHMSRFAKGIHVGKYVKQGQIIGYVGSTGIATGPHLHYEIRMNHKPKNPLRVRLPEAFRLGKKQLKRFKETAKGLLAQLTLQSGRHSTDEE